jgi:hypothetical protein
LGELLCTILKEVHKVRFFAAKVVSIILNSLMTDRIFLYAGMEELQVLGDFSASDWRNLPKFNQSIVRHLFEPACLRRCSRTGRKAHTSSRSMPSQPWLSTTRLCSMVWPPAWANCVRRLLFHLQRRPRLQQVQVGRGILR